MDFNRNTSLSRMAAISVISSAWYYKQALSLLQEHSPNPRCEQIWTNIENQVYQDLKALLVPISVQKHLIDFYQPMGKELRTWMEDHSFMNLSEKTTSNVLSWSTLGAIDRKRTAEKILTNATANKSYFRLACMYSLEDEILRMWPGVMEFYDISVPQDSKTDPQVLFWICYLQNSVANLMKALDYVGYKDTMQFAFWLSISTNNEIAAEFFLSKLPAEDKQRVVSATAKRLCETDNTYNYFMLPFLLLHLDPSQLDELLQNYSQPILLQFLKWPRQYYFMDIVNKTWTYLTARTYYRVLDDIAHCVCEFDRCELYHKIFDEFWRNGPNHCCEYVRNMCLEGTFLIRLALLRSSDYIIEIIIKTLTQEQKQSLVLSFNGTQLFASLLKRQKWGMVKYVFKECIPIEKSFTFVEKLVAAYTDAFEHNLMFCNITSTERDTFFGILNNLKDS